MTHALLDRYEAEYVKYNDISQERWRQQRKLLLAFEETLDGDLATAGYPDLQRFAGELVGSFHVNTVRKKLNQIRPFYSWAYAAQIITPERYVELRRVKDPRGATAESTPNPYSLEEIQAFWEQQALAWPLLPESGLGSQAITRWQKGQGPWGRVWKHAMRLQLDAMVRLALDCGLRRSEIFRLELDDVHYDNAYLVVWRAAKGKRGVRVRQLVPFTIDARQAVYTWLEFRAMMNPGHERPWLSCYAGTAVQPMWATRFASLLKTVGDDWEWHRFRHTCATQWLRAGMELEYVSKLLGHATLQQTLAYAKIAKGDLTREVERHEAAFSEAVSRAA